MLKMALCFLMLTQAAAVDSFNGDSLKKEIGPLQESVKGTLAGSVARIMQDPKATYLEGYGVVITVEVALETPANPFSRVKSDQELRSSVTQRRKEIKSKLSDLLTQRIVKLDSLGPAHSVAVVVYLLNGTPVETPDLPTQLVISVRKDSPADVKIREY